jgi:hypothetical protein
MDILWTPPISTTAHLLSADFILRMLMGPDDVHPLQPQDPRPAALRRLKRGGDFGQMLTERLRAGRRRLVRRDYEATIRPRSPIR